MFDDIKNEDMPEDLEKVFINNLKEIMFNVDEDKDVNDFTKDFLKKYGRIIYKYHLKTFTKEEIWRTILISKSKQFQKLMKFQIDCENFVENLVNSFIKENESNT